MLKSDILDTVFCAIDRLIGGEWTHEVSIFGMSDRHIDFEIDQKEYVLVLNEVKDGHDWSEFVFGYENSEEEMTQNDQP